MNTRQKYLGIDPGRSKTGLALVDAAGSILALHIAHTEHIEVELSAFAGKEQLAGIIMGLASAGLLGALSGLFAAG